MLSVSEHYMFSKGSHISYLHTSPLLYARSAISSGLWILFCESGEQQGIMIGGLSDDLLFWSEQGDTGGLRKGLHS